MMFVCGLLLSLNFGLYIFMESLWKNRIYFPLVVEAVACLILSCSFTNELLGHLTLISKQGLRLGIAQDSSTVLSLGSAPWEGDSAYTAPGPKAWDTALGTVGKH